MAALDFPSASSSPWVAPNGVIYTYIGTSPNGYWEANTANASQNLTNIFVMKTGSTMSGALKLDNAANGSNPDLAFDGDVNTGIYSPGADSLAITTAGTQRVTVNSSGRVGIGTTSPDAPLQVGVLDSPGTLRGGLAVKTVSNGLGNSEAAIYIEESSGGEGYYLRVDSDGGLAFDNSAAIPPTLYLSDSNNVGIGTTSPTDNGSDTMLALKRAGSGESASLAIHAASNASSLIRFADGTSTAAERNAGSITVSHSDQSMQFGIQNVERMRIDSSGNVGIGTSSPNAILTTNPEAGNFSSTYNNYDGVGLFIRGNGTSSNGNYGPALAFGSCDSGVVNQENKHCAISVVQTGTDPNQTGLAFWTHPSNTSTNNLEEKVRIDSSGNVGIGTTSPGKLLHVKSTTVGTIMSLEGASTTYLNFISSTDTGGYIGYGGTNLGFWTNGSEKMRIDGSGNVIVGGTATSSTNAAYISQNGTYVSNRTAGTNDLWNGKLSGTVTSTINADGSAIFASTVLGNGSAASPSLRFTSQTNMGLFKGASGGLGFATAGSQRMEIDSSGNVGIGTTLPGNNKLRVLQPIGDQSGGAAIKAEGTPYGTNKAIHAYIASINVDRSLIYAENLNGVVMNVNAAGNVGIGTADPDDVGNFSRALDVSGASGASVLVRNNNSATNCGLFAYYGTSTYVMNRAAGPVLFYTSNTEKMRIDSSGKLGIGTSAPQQTLHLKGAYLRIDDAAQNLGTMHIGAESGVNSFYSQAANGGAGAQPLRFMIGNSTERMRIDSSGRLLVGTSTAVTSGAASDSVVQIVGKKGSPTDLGQLTIARGNVGTNLGSGAEIGELIFSDNAGSIYAQINCNTDGTSGSNDYPGRLVFSTTADGASSPTERMRITSAGTIQCFDSGGNGLHVRSSAAANTANNLMVGWHSATSTTNGTYCYIVYSNGNVANTNNSYGAISDIKLKENIVDASSQWNDLKALQVRNYNFIEGQTHTQIGVVAQEVELVSPGLVSESPDRDEDGNDLGTVTKSVNYSVLYMKAVKALQEAMERIETLEQRLSDAGIA